MKQLWTGRIEMITPPSESGNTKCFTNVFVWADSSEDFALAISHHLSIEGVSVIEIQECHPVRDDEHFPEETQPLLD